MNPTTTSFTTPAESSASSFVPEFYWLIHHGQLIEMTVEPIEYRVEYVKSNKPQNEISTRLEWMRKVRGLEKLPRAYVDACRACADARRALADAGRAYVDAYRAYVDAGHALDDTRRAYVDAYRAYVDAYRTSYPSLVALHKEECPGCPFDYEKETLIFPSS